MKNTTFIVYLAFSLGLAAACYLRPSPDDFDRYAYESLIRSAKQPVEDVYPIVKHESSRAEASTIMDSPGHLAQLEPLYAIRPVYIQLATLISDAGLPPQKSIDLVSAISLFLIALFAYAATQNYLYSALLMTTPAVVIVFCSEGWCGTESSAGYMRECSQHLRLEVLSVSTLSPVIMAGRFCFTTASLAGNTQPMSRRASVWSSTPIHF